MNYKYLIFSLSIVLLTILKVNAQSLNIDYDNVCRSYGFNEKQCNELKKQENNRRINNSNNIEQEQVYKIRLRDAATGNLNQRGIFSPGDKDREEWVVVTVINNQKFKIRHATNIENKFWGTRQWYDHPAIAIRVCAIEQFDSTDCQTTQGDLAVLPQGKSIYDLQIDFKYSEGGAIYTRSVQISKDTK